MRVSGLKSLNSAAPRHTPHYPTSSLCSFHFHGVDRVLVGEGGFFLFFKPAPLKIGPTRHTPPCSCRPRRPRLRMGASDVCVHRGLAHACVVRRTHRKAMQNSAREVCLSSPSSLPAVGATLGAGVLLPPHPTLRLLLPHAPALQCDAPSLAWRPPPCAATPPRAGCGAFACEWGRAVGGFVLCCAPAAGATLAAAPAHGVKHTKNTHAATGDSHFPTPHPQPHPPLPHPALGPPPDRPSPPPPLRL